MSMEDPMLIDRITQRIAAVNQRVAYACQRCGRNESDVQVIAVTKYVSLDTTRAGFQAGLLHIGENRWQDVLPKWEALHEQGTWHFIGHVQSNKVKDIVGKFTYIHALDRLSLAKEIHKHAEAMGITVKCFIQVNISKEQTKFGVDPQDITELVNGLLPLHHIHVVGLMTLAPYTTDAELSRPIFRSLKQLRDKLNEQALLPYDITHLSMGMSNDFEVAIEEGATWIRLGSVLMGKELDERGNRDGPDE